MVKSKAEKNEGMEEKLYFLSDREGAIEGDSSSRVLLATLGIE